MSQEIIVAISTAKGRAAVGIVRLSGHDLGSVVASIFRSKGASTHLRDRRPHLGEMLGEHGEVIDQGLLLWMSAPQSYTGEDVVELHCHGNPWILERLVGAAIQAGARAAGPGEFTRRAYMNGKLDLIQADAVMQIINASSERGLEAARRLLSGELSRRLSTLSSRLVDVLKWLEMAIDFPEEDIEQATDAQLLSWLMSIRDEVKAMSQSFRQGHRARVGVRVPICGRANVGKSSLFNQLLGYRRSIVADVPGTTRDLVEATIELAGISVTFQDTAGLRESEDALEVEGIGIAREAIEGAELALLVVDGTCGMTPEDMDILSAIQSSGIEYVGILNKCDRVSTAVRACVPGDWISLSALTGEGLASLRETIGRRLGEHEAGEGVLLTARWQKEILQQVGDNLVGAISAVSRGMSPEAAAFELYEALHALDEMRGGQGREEVMDRIFAEFCLGK